MQCLKEFPPPTIQTEIQIATKNQQPAAPRPTHNTRPPIMSPQRLLPPIPWPQGTPEMQSLLGEDFLLSAHGAKQIEKRSHGNHRWLARCAERRQQEDSSCES